MSRAISIPGSSKPKALAVAAVAALAALSIATLSGCAPGPANDTKPSETTLTTVEPSNVDWSHFSATEAPVSFDLPKDWDVVRKETSNDSAGMYQAEVVDAAGKPQLYFSNKAQGLGGACSADAAKLTITDLDETPVTPAGYTTPEASAAPGGTVDPRFVFRIAEANGKFAGTLSISNAPKPAESCMFYNMLSTGRNIAFFTTSMQVDSTDLQGIPFASLDEAKAFQQSEEYATLKRILTSVSFTG